jgi:hypothetical protein
MVRYVSRKGSHAVGLELLVRGIPRIRQQEHRACVPAQCTGPCRSIHFGPGPRM